jgi:hypothetical protein
MQFYVAACGRNRPPRVAANFSDVDKNRGPVRTKNSSRSSVSPPMFYRRDRRTGVSIRRLSMDLNACSGFCARRSAPCITPRGSVLKSHAR